MAEEFSDMARGQLEMPHGLGYPRINTHLPERAFTTYSYVDVKVMRVLREKAKSLKKAIDDGLPYEQHLPSAEEMVGARIIHTTGRPPHFITDSLIDAHALVDRLQSRLTTRMSGWSAAALLGLFSSSFLIHRWSNCQLF